MRKKRNYLIWVFLLLLAFLLLNIFTPISSRIRNSVFSLTFTVQSVLVDAGSGFFENLEIFQNAKEIREEIRFLRKKNSKLLAKLANLNEIKEENKALRDALNIDVDEKENLVFTQVIGKDLTGDIINVKYKGDIKEGDPVVTSEGVLVGVVEEVYDNFSKIGLITSKNSSFEVRVQNKDEPIGVLEGGGRGNLLLKLLPKDKEVNRGDRVMTLAHEEIGVGGIFIGRILEIEESDIEAFNSATVWQGIDYRYLNHLFVIKR